MHKLFLGKNIFGSSQFTNRSPLATQIMIIKYVYFETSYISSLVKKVIQEKVEW